MDYTLTPITLPPLPPYIMTFLSHIHILLVIFVIFTCGYLVISAVLFYHWSRYGMHHGGIIAARAIFSIVSLIFFGFALTAFSSI